MQREPLLTRTLNHQVSGSKRRGAGIAVATATSDQPKKKVSKTDAARQAKFDALKTAFEALFDDYGCGTVCFDWRVPSADVVNCFLWSADMYDSSKAIDEEYCRNNLHIHIMFSLRNQNITYWQLTDRLKRTNVHHGELPLSHKTLLLWQAECDKEPEGKLQVLRQPSRHRRMLPDSFRGRVMRLPLIELVEAYLLYNDTFMAEASKWLTEPCDKWLIPTHCVSKSGLESGMGVRLRGLRGLRLST